MSAPRSRILLAFAAVYVIWGSTYLGIRYAVETIPPFFMAASRFLAAGAVLYVGLRLRGAPRPTAGQWKSAAITGFLMLLMGNGAVSWAEQHVPSGVTALVIAITPLWFVSIEWAQHSIRPSRAVVAGLLLGTVGMVVLIDPARLTESGHIDLVGAAVLLVASACWALGSMYARSAEQPARPLLGTAMQMLSGGGFLLLAGFVAGEAARFDASRISAASVASLLYLTVFGSLIGFSAYAWLLHKSTPARVATYAYVNPVIAVLLGWLVAGEPMNGRIALAAAIIVAGVAMITVFKSRSTGVSREGAE